MKKLLLLLLIPLLGNVNVCYNYRILDRDMAIKDYNNTVTMNLLREKEYKIRWDHPHNPDDLYYVYADGKDKPCTRITETSYWYIRDHSYETMHN